MDFHLLIRVIVAALHFLTLAVGFWSVLSRGAALKNLTNAPATFRKLFFYDTIWGIAAIFWIATGLARAFGGLEKGTDYYLSNGWFYIKMALFLAILLLEIKPMVTFVRWRIMLKKGATPDISSAPMFARLNFWETVLLVAIVLFAVLMARAPWIVR